MTKTIEVPNGASSMFRMVRVALCVLVVFALCSSMAYGQSKTLVNSSSQQISVTLLVRAGSSTSGQAGPVVVDLAAGASATVTFGTATNIYLNGVTISSGANGAVYTQQNTVTKRGSTLDNTLNTNSSIVFTFANSVFTVTGTN